MKTLIKNGRVVDPSQNLDAVMDVLIEDGVVAAIDKNIEAAADEVYMLPALWLHLGLLMYIRICANRALKQKKTLLPAPWQQRQAV